MLLCFSIPSFAFEEAWTSINNKWVTSVKTQMGGLCWAYAICATAESDVLAQNFEKNIDFSEGYLYSIHNIYADEKDGDSPASIINITQSFNALAYEKSFPTQYPSFYSEEDIKKNDCKYTISSFGELKQENLKVWIKEHGAAICSLQLTDKNALYVNHKEKVISDHVVTIVGWDDTISKDLFDNPPENNGAWLCKNSWGKDFGSNGYFWLSYEDMAIDNFFGLTVSIASPTNHISYTDMANSQFSQISLSGTNPTEFGIGNTFAVQKGDILSSFNVVLRGTGYSYKIYAFKDSISKDNLKSKNLLISGDITSCEEYDSEEYIMSEIPINYKAEEDCILFIEIVTPSQINILVDKSAPTSNSFVVQYFNNQPYFIRNIADSNSKCCFKISLNKATFEKDYIDNPISITQALTQTPSYEEFSIVANPIFYDPCLLILFVIPFLFAFIERKTKNKEIIN